MQRIGRLDRPWEDYREVYLKEWRRDRTDGKNERKEGYKRTIAETLSIKMDAPLWCVLYSPAFVDTKPRRSDLGRHMVDSQAQIIFCSDKDLRCPMTPQKELLPYFYK